MNILKDIKTKNPKNIILNNIDTLLIICIIILSFILNFYAISNYGYGNEYYAASVSSMTKSLKNFLYCSFDPSGILSVDKAPLGLWIQVLSVHIFGFKGFALMLPQAISGSLSCFIIYIMVKRYFKSKASALLSALFFALTPIIVATSRNNTIDMQLIFVILLSLLFFFKFLEYNNLRYLLLSSLLIGIGFNIKMMQAFLIIPSVCLTYIIFCKLDKKKKTLYAVISVLLITITSTLWPTFVSLTPVSERPYIDSTSDNSIFELITGHNGIFRITGTENIGSSSIISSTNLSDDNNTQDLYSYNDYIGHRSILRLFSQSIYGQISWLIPFAICFIFIFINTLKKQSSTEKLFFTFWLSYFILMFLFFSFAGFFHRYYLCMIAPPICILSAQGIKIMIKHYKSSTDFKKYIYPICFFITMAVELINVYKFSNSPSYLKSIMIFLFTFTIIMMITNFKKCNKNTLKLISSLSIIAVLCAPFYWCLTTIMYVPNVTKPSAGPEIVNTTLDIKNIKGGITTVKSNLDLKRYLINNYKDGSFLIAAPKSSDVSPLIIDTSLPVLCTNGFTGDINYISLDYFKELVQDGKIRYFIIYDKDDVNNNITEYVEENASLIDPDDYNSLASKNKINSLNSNSIQKKYDFSLYYFDN